MNKYLIALITVIVALGNAYSQKYILPKPSTQPSKAQMKQIERRYGMFIHFGLNTFEDEEWTDGTKPASDYCPTTIDAEQWVLAARDAGMKYIILTVKHHEGFCLWDSKYTDYDVASSGNTTNVVEATAKACKKYGIGLGIYYSLWDRNRNADTDDRTKDAEYNEYMINQLNELLDIIGKHTHVVELWLDGSWVKANYRWPLLDIYQTIKRKEPDCLISTNWTIGQPDNIDKSAQPTDQKEGYPIRYFPSDFRLGDPRMPADNDPKLFTYNGNLYYLPWESTICISGRWFYHTKDENYKSLDELEKVYRQCTKNDNIFILNLPPARDGRLRARDVELLKQLRQRIER
ncbi:MAG: alpha-L-fucosidase [Muribaculaceae bacterium]